MKKINELPEGVTLVATRGVDGPGVFLYEDEEGHGIIHNAAKNSFYQTGDVGDAWARGYWKPVGETSEEQNENWIRSMGWDLSSTFEGLLLDIRSELSPVPLVRFMHTSAAIPMPKDVMADAVAYLMDRGLESTLPTRVKEEYFKEVYNRTLRNRKGDGKRVVLKKES